MREKGYKLNSGTGSEDEEGRETRIHRGIREKERPAVLVRGTSRRDR